MEGWIKIHRKLLDNPIVCKDSDYLSVWIYLLLNATHKEYDTLFKGKRITLQKGELITGRKAIAKKLKINESKVQNILNSFKNEHQIEQQTSNKNRLITILNWKEYQSEQHQEEQQVNNNQTTAEQQVNTNKNDKNIYLFLFNKYSEKISGKNFGEKIKAVGQCKQEEQYSQMSIENQDKLFKELMSLK